MFASTDKIQNNAGWATFSKNVFENLLTIEDFFSGVRTIEARCENCLSYIGTVDESKGIINQVFLVNSAALVFRSSFYETAD